MKTELFNKLMAASKDVLEKTKAVVAAPTDEAWLAALDALDEAESREEKLISSLPANLRREIREQRRELEAKFE
jgi:hypothetical protein